MPTRTLQRALRRRTLFIAVGVVSAGLVLAGCSSSGKSAADTKAPSSGASTAASSNTGLPEGTPKAGGTLTFAQASVGADYDPLRQQLTTFNAANVMSAIFGSTLNQYAGAQTVSPGFITSFKPSTDFKTWTAILAPGMKFSDGTPFDAAAIAYNITRDAAPANGSSFIGIAQKVTPTAVDATTLRLDLVAPDSQFDKEFAYAFSCIGSPTAEQAEGAGFATKPVGAGPFKLESIVSAQTLTVVKNPNYALFAKDQPYLDSIVFQALATPQQQAAALSQGTAQLSNFSGGQQADLFKAAALNTYTVQSIGGGSLVFNMKVAPFNNPVARQAIVLALDRTATADIIHPGDKVATNFFPSSSPFYDKQYDYVAQDKAKAQQLFDQLAAAGTPLSFTFLDQGNVPTAVNTTQSVQGQLSTFKNVKVTIKLEPGPQQLSDMTKGNFEMTQFGLYSPLTIPYATEQVLSTGNSNYSGWNNATTDAAVHDLYATSDAAQQKKDWGIVQEQLNKDNPVMYLDQTPLGFAATKNVTGIKLVGIGFIPLFGGIGYAP